MQAKIKKRNPSWGGRAKTVTFIVTKDCQLACKYCYLVGKNNKESMSFDVAKKTVDYILSKEFNEKSIIWEFIGGEPFLEIDLVDKICDYIKLEMYRLNHKWFNSYRFSFTTNGLNYSNSKVQKFIKKNIKHLSIAITIDGTREKHDINRVYKSDMNRGSYDDVLKNIPLWLKQFPEVGTKVTVSSEDIPYICESVLHLYELGIKQVNINCVFENAWKEGDDKLLEEQLIMLADNIIEKDLYKDYVCTFFSETIGKPMNPDDNCNSCGSGKMIAVDNLGNFYPCNRFTKFSLRDKEARVIGNVNEGLNLNRIRPFLAITRDSQSSAECFNCEVASGCAWCQGENYDSSSLPSIYKRSTAICLMHKARVRANNYYWNKLFHKLEFDNIDERNVAVQSNSSITVC